MLFQELVSRLDSLVEELKKPAEVSALNMFVILRTLIISECIILYLTTLISNRYFILCSGQCLLFQVQKYFC